MREQDLSPELEARIDTFCASALGASDLSDEVREELRAHFRDRILGYLNREDELSEADAFVLAREHFGKPAEVRAMLLNEHAEDALPALYRRMAASAALGVVVQPLAGLALSPFFNQDHLTPNGIGWVFTLSSLICTPLFLVPLRVWQKQIESGAKPWFQRWPPAALVALLLAVYAGVGALQLLNGDAPARPPYFEAAASVLFTANYAIQYGIWFWWCRIPPRSWKLFAHAALGIGLYGWPLLLMMSLYMGQTSADYAYSLVGFIACLPALILQGAFYGLLFLGLRRLIPALRTT